MRCLMMITSEMCRRGGKLIIIYAARWLERTAGRGSAERATRECGTRRKVAGGFVVPPGASLSTTCAWSDFSISDASFHGPEISHSMDELCQRLALILGDTAARTACGGME
nr:hypothetical protein CFP56_22498 [Quercus suber]